jgi:hypothetical protein
MDCTKHLVEAGAFQKVVRVFEKRPDVHWLTGIPQSIDEKGETLYSRMVLPYSSTLIKQGFYGPQLPFIQQESCFWRAALWPLVDQRGFSQCQLAGDFFLWRTFAENHRLWILPQILAGARIHANRLSADLKPYFEEQKTLAAPRTLRASSEAWFRKIGRFIPEFMKRKLAGVL